MPSVQTSNQTELQQHTSKDNKTGSNNQLNANTGGNKTPSEQPEYIKQVQIMIEKKIRNLEKRKQKLEEYQELAKKGTVLNADQLLAVSKYEEVKTSLELVRDLDKQLVQLGNDTLKQLKKQAKKEQIEREEQLKEKLREAEKLKSLLNTFSHENVRNDFLEGRNGAVQLSKDEISLFEEFSRLINPKKLFKPAENEFSETVDHLLNLVDNKNKAVLTTTYSELKKLFDKVIQSSYWTYEPEKPAQVQVPAQQAQQQQQSQEQHQQVQQQQQTEVPQETESKQNATYQHNTSTEDYVIVTSQEVENTQLQQQPGTFFTTLNNENLTQNTSEEINFLQDSEIAQQQYEEQHHDHQHHQPQDQQQYTNQGNYYKSRQYSNNNNDGGYQPRSNGSRRPFNPSDNRGPRGGYQGGRGGPQGGRGGGYQGSRGGSGGYRGSKPRGAPSGGYRNNQPEARNDNGN